MGDMEKSLPSLLEHSLIAWTSSVNRWTPPPSPGRHDATDFLDARATDLL